MIRQAVVFASDRSLERVAGLSLLARCVLMLGRAGIERVRVIGPIERAVLTADRDLARAGVVVDLGIEGLDGPVVIWDAETLHDAAALRQVVATEPTDRPVVWVGSDRAPAGLAVAPRPGGESFAAATAGDCETRELATWWTRVTDRASARAAEAALFRSLRKRTDGPVSRWINRPISLAVTRQLIRTPVTPNQMTIVANVIGVIGIVLVFQPTPLTLGLGALLVQLQSILDGCDGEIARLKLQSSRIGEWLDNVLDDQVNIAYGIALGFAAATVTGEPFWRWVGLAAGLAFFIHNLVFYAELALVYRSGNPFNFKWWFEKDGEDVTAMLAKPSLGSHLLSLVRAVVRRDVFLFAFLVLAVIELPHAASAWYAVVAASQFALITLHVLNGGARKRLAGR